MQQFDYFLQPFTKLFQRRAFLHWFVGEGMEEIGLLILFPIKIDIQSRFLQELIDAENRMKDLFTNYQQYENISNE